MKKSSATSCGLQVAVRVRPLNTREKQNPAVFEAIETGETYLTVKIGESETIYAFDSVFGVNSATMDLFTQVAEPIVQSSMSGVNGTIFAYGQTSSGKTFTMQGSEQEPGILRLAAKKLFAPNDKWAFTIAVSYIEIYNERVKDLLATLPQQQSKLSSMFMGAAEEPDLKIREDPQRGFFVEGVSEKPVSTYAELMDRFYDGEKKRHVAGTDMNEKSSRSHTIFSISITAKPLSGGGLFKSKLSLVDLAGSESGRSTNAEGERLKEGGQINKSLLTLSMVISSLASAANRSHVKFRDSKLTQILQPSLVGNCMTAVVCCVTPASTFVGETNSTLKFANSAKHLKTEFVVNQIVDANMRSAKGYQDQIDALEQQLHKEREERKQKEEEWQHRVEQTKFLLDSARTELELTRASHSQATEQASSTSTAMEQLAERSSRELSAMAARFEREVTVREALERELSASATTIGTLTGELGEMQVRVEHLSEQVRDANAESFELKMQVDEHKQDAKALRSELNETYAALQQEYAKTQQAADVAKQWEVRSSEFEQALAVQIEQFDYLKQDNAGLKLKCQEQAAGLLAGQRECDSLMRDLDSSLQTIAVLEREAKELQVKNSDLDNQLANRMGEYEALQQELKDTANRMEAKRVEAKQHSDARSAALQREFDDQSALARELKQQVEISALTKVALETDLHNAQTKVEEEKRANLVLRDELALANERVTVMQRSLNANGEAAKRELELVQQRMEHELEQRDASAAALQSEVVRAKQSFDEVNTQLAAVAAEHTLLLDQHRKLETLLETTNADHVKTSQAIHAELNQAKAAYEQVTSMKNQELASLMDKCATLERDLQAQVAQMQSTNDSFAEERTLLRDELATSKQATNELSSELSESQSIVIVLQNKVAELEQAKLDLSMAKETAAQQLLEQEQFASSLQHSKAQLETTTAELSSKLVELETARNQLQRDLVDAQQQHNAKEIDLRAAVGNNNALMEQITLLKKEQSVLAAHAEELVLVKHAKLDLEHELNAAQQACEAFESQIFLASEEKQSVVMQLTKELEVSNQVIAELQCTLCGREHELAMLQRAVQTSVLDSQAFALERAHLNSTIFTMQHAKEQLETSTRELSSKVLDLEAARDELTSSLQAREAYEAQLLLAGDEKQSMVTQLIKELETSNRVISELQRSLGEKENCVRGKEQELAMLQHAAQTSELDSLAFALERAHFNNEVGMLHHSLQQAKEQLETTRNELASSLQARAAYEAQLLLAGDEKQSMVTQLTKKLKTSNQAISELQRSLHGKEHELVMLQQAVQTGELEHEALSLEHGHMVQHLTKDISVLDQSLQHVNEQLEVTRHQLLGAQNQCSALQMDLCAAVDNNNALMEQTATLAANTEELVLVKRAKLDLEGELNAALQARAAYETQLQLASDEKQIMAMQLTNELETSNQAIAMLQQAVQIGELNSQALTLEISELHESIIESKRVCVALHIRVGELVRKESMDISHLKITMGNSVAELNFQLCAEQDRVAELQSADNHNYWDSWGIALEAAALHNLATESEWSTRCTNLTADLLASNNAVQALTKDLECTKQALDAQTYQLTIVETQHQAQLERSELQLLDECKQVEHLQDAMNQALCEQAAICLDYMLMEAKHASIAADGQAKLVEVESVLETKLAECDELTRELAQMEQQVQDKQAELCNEQELMRLAMQECAELKSKLESNQLKLHEYQGIDIQALQHRISALQFVCNIQQMDYEAIQLENEACNEAVLEWARVDCDRLVWERTCQVEDEAELRLAKLAGEITKLEQDKQEMGMQVDSKDMYIKCLQVETDKLALHVSQHEHSIGNLQHAINFLEHARECELEEHACVVTKLQTEAKRVTIVDGGDDKLLRQCEHALAETKQAMETMKRSKDYWISRLQGEINELYLLNACMEEQQQQFCRIAPTPRRKHVPITPGRVPLTEREQKRIRLALEEDDGGVENRKLVFPPPARDEVLDNVFASLKVKSSQELDSKLKEMEGELLLLRERTKKLEKAKLTQAQADQINQLKRDYLALKAEHARAKPASEESIAKYEEQCLEAIRTRDEALDKLRRMVEETREREAAEVESSKFTIQRLERENLMLFKRVRELGGFPTLL